jgi:hypothetical protein
LARAEWPNSRLFLQASVIPPYPSHFPPSGQGLVRIDRLGYCFHRRIARLILPVLTTPRIRTLTALVAVSGSILHTMSSESPLPTPTQNVVLDTSKLPASTTSSVWDRISKWVSENKAVVYTIAGVAVVVTGAGVVYYLSDSNKSSASSTSASPKKSKNQRRKEKKKAEEEKKAKAASVQEGRSSKLSHYAVFKP